MNAKEKLVKARSGLVLDMPFFGSLSLRLTLKEDKTCKTAWTDGVTLGYNPKFIDTLSLSETKGLFCHEVMHCALGHMTRRGERDSLKWNAAGDYVINPILMGSKMTLPAGALVDENFKDKSTEDVYATFPQEKPQDQPIEQPQEDEDSEQEGEDSGGGSAEQEQEEDKDGDEKGEGGGEGDSDDSDEDGEGEGTGDGQGEGDSESEGQGQEQQNNEPPKPEEWGEVRDAKDENGNTATEAQRDQAEANWKVATAQAAQLAKMHGELPAGLERLVDQIVQGQVDWRETLRRFIDMIAKNDYTWSTPNRRHIANGMFLPAMKSEQLPPIVVAIDTSGSIGGPLLEQFAGELTSILEEYDTTCHVVYCDAQVNGTEVFTRDNLPVTLKALGGGGTDFRPVFDWAADSQNLDNAPACLIYLTDLEGSFPESEPEYPTLWVNFGNPYMTAPFGETVKI